MQASVTLAHGSLGVAERLCADENDVAVLQSLAHDAPSVHGYAICAVQVFDDRLRRSSKDYRVMATDVFGVDL